MDSGSSICVLSEKVFEKLCKDTVALREADRVVRTANGSLLKLRGACTLQIQLDHLCFEQEFIVANIEEPGILGISFLDQHEVDIKIRKRILKTNKGRIKLHKHGTDKCFRIQMCESVTIPPQSEAFVKTYTLQNCPSQLNIVEPTNKQIHQGLFVAKTLVDTSQNQMVVSVLNVGSKGVKLKENTTLGLIQPIEALSVCDSDTSKFTTHSTHEELPDHLKPLVENASSELNDLEKQKLSSLIFEYQDVFMSPEGKLKQTSLAEHYIDTGDTRPFKVPCRRIPMFKRAIVEQEIKKMLDQDVIEPSNSAWNSPILLVEKKSGEWRFCVDLRKLNSVTKLDTYPLPNISETLDRLSNSSYYSTLDMISGYWQIGLNPHDRCKTSFAIPGIGTYMFKVMCFGLKNAPGSFSRLMEIVLRHLQYDKCLVYLDDIIVLGQNFEIALRNLELVFLRMRQSGLQLKASKCKLLQKQTVFLGHLITPNGITCDPDKIKAIKDWPQPQDKTELKSFLGLTGYYRKMVPAYAELAIPLTRLTKKKVKFHWGPEQESAFEKLKNCLIQPPVLAFPLEDGGSFLMDCDASGCAIGCVLSQYQDNQERVIAYGSHTLNQAQQNYCTTKRELYSVVYFVQHFKQYLLGRRFILRVDHRPLLWLCNFQDASSIFARWISILGAYEYDLVFRPGHLHANADTMSRKPKRLCHFPDCKDCSQTSKIEKTEQTSESVNVIPAQSDVPVPNWLAIWSNEQIKEMQSNDLVLKEILRLKEISENKPEKAEISQAHKNIITLWNQWELLKIKGSILYREKENELGEKHYQLLAPREMQECIFQHLHTQRYAGHLGRDRTLNAIKKGFIGLPWT